MDLESLPSMLQRYYAVMRDLDSSLQGIVRFDVAVNIAAVQRQNEHRCEQEIEDIKKGIQSGNITPNTSHFRFSDEALDEQKHCIQIADEKVALAVRAYDMSPTFSSIDLLLCITEEALFKILVDAHIQQLDDYMRKFDDELRRAEKKDVTSSAGVASLNLDNNTRSGRASESSKAGRKKTRAVAAAAAAVADPPPNPSMELDLPVDPNEPTYCFCEQVSYGEMVACDNPDALLRDHIYCEIIFRLQLTFQYNYWNLASVEMCTSEDLSLHFC
ncbi:hypothetical protein ACLOJK_007614 [Asimina triloba]